MVPAFKNPSGCLVEGPFHLPGMGLGEQNQEKSVRVSEKEKETHTENFSQYQEEFPIKSGIGFPGFMRFLSQGLSV